MNSLREKRDGETLFTELTPAVLAKRQERRFRRDLALHRQGGQVHLYLRDGLLPADHLHCTSEVSTKFPWIHRGRSANRAR